MSSLIVLADEKFNHWVGSFHSWFLERAHALYGLSATRILVGTALLGILVGNFGSRHILWGAGSFWAEPNRQTSDFGYLITMYQGLGPSLFTFVYCGLMALSVALILGWRTRLVSCLLVLGMAGLVERADLVGDQGDNIARIGLTLMILMNTSQYWSLDSRRRRRGIEIHRPSLRQRIWYGLPILPRWAGHMLHNVALVTLVLQVFILYTASALYKVQGDLWQAGTALHYPLSLHEYGVFPALNQLVTGNDITLTLITYFSVYVQLFFAPGLLHPVSRRFILVGVVFLHGGIAVLMGLPWFSLAMLAFDAIFVSSTTYRRLESMLRAVSHQTRTLTLSRLRPGPDR